MSTRKLLFAGLASVACICEQITDEDLPALAQAQAYFQQNAAKYGLDDLRQQLKGRKANHDPKGSVHIRFDQYFYGVPVFEGEAIAHVDRTGQVSVTDAIRKQISATSKPGITRAAARTLALKAVNQPAEAQIHKAVLEMVTAGRVAQDTLAWHVRIFGRAATVNAAQWDVFVASCGLLWPFLAQLRQFVRA